ncbi:MAG TPA: hypothetical protein VFK74_02240, partial [Azospira sp.]|nr:hypothetical protein [Azospira sp.]
MSLKLHWQTGQWITSGAQLALLAIGAQTESRAGWLATLALMAAISLIAWAGAVKRRRAIADTPTSRIASAAQGYVELQGTGRPLEGLPLVSPLTALPCLWYRYTTEEKDSDNKWKVVDQGESEASFLLDDDSGICVVDPVGGEIYSQHREQWTRGDSRHTEWKLIKGDPIYALGEFRTLAGGDGLLDPAEELKLLLAEWKKNPAELHRRFDLNGDGQLDQDEWLLVRQAARREVEKLHQQARAQPSVNI